MSIQLKLEVNEINTVLEGLSRVIENAGRVQQTVREQANEQLKAQQQAAQADKVAPTDPGAATRA